MLRPTQSNIIYLQQLGRALNVGTSNNSIVFDLVNNSSCSNIACLRNEIEKAIERKNNDTDLINGEKEKFDLKDFHIFDYIQEVTDVIRLIDKRCKGSFEFRLGQFLEYKKKYGIGYVERSRTKEWNGLFDWAVYMRQRYKRNELNPKHIELLKDNGFVFIENEFRCDQLEQHIKAYIGEKKTNTVSQKYVCDDGYRLGEIIHNAKNPNHYGHDIIKEWGINITTHDEKWQKTYLILKKFVNEHGTEKLTINTVYQGCNIGTWTSNQRKKYKNGTLSSERIKLLFDIGFIFGAHELNWNEFIKNVAECLKQTGSITRNTIFNGIKIGARLTGYKDRYKKGNISSEQYLQLKKLGIDLAKEGSYM